MKSLEYDRPYEEELFDFSTALDALKEGKRVSRKGWNGENMYLELQVPDKNSKMTLPYIYIGIPNPSHDDRVPWLASQTDLLSNDWIIL